MLANNAQVPYGTEITLSGELITSDDFDEYLKKAEDMDSEELFASDADYTEMRNILEG